MVVLKLPYICDGNLSISSSDAPEKEPLVDFEPRNHTSSIAGTESAVTKRILNHHGKAYRKSS
jgi:hypothetical protein